MIKGSAYQTYFYKSLKIVFAYYKNGIPYSDVFSGKTVLKHFSNNSMEKVKTEVKKFLRNPEGIRKIIEANHIKFLKNKHIKNPEQIGINKSTTKKKNRETRCHGCKGYLSSYDNYSCNKCKWILCSCGACGCGFDHSQYKF